MRFTLTLAIAHLLLLTQAITYLEEDGIVTLKDSTFVQTITSSKTAWVVEFFSHTCGFCISFAPIFTDFARNVKSWSTVVQLGAVTSDDRQWFLNNNVTKFPTLKFFLPWDMDSVLVLEGWSVEDLNAQLLTALHVSVAEGRGLRSWPPLNYVVEIDDLKAKASKNVLNLMVVEDNDAQLNHTGELVIMDHSSIMKDVSIHRSHIDIASQYNMPEAALYLIMGQQFVQLPGVYNRTGLNDIIANLTTNFLNTSLDLSDALLPYGSQNLTLAVTDETYIYRPAHGLKMADLLKGLRDTLWQEVAGVHSIDGRAMEALRAFIKLLADYLPVDKHVTNFLNLLLDKLDNQSDIVPQEWLQLLNETESDLAYIPEGLEWQGCKGSNEILRGYPCSVWMIFHTLTVGAFNDKRESTDNKTGLHALLTIRNYMEHFFSCEACRVNFLKHTAYLQQQLNDPVSVWSKKRAVLEMWRLHNIVNKRLHQDPHTEDPRHPKIQFPALQDCEACRRAVTANQSVFELPESDWNLQEVFEFLVGYYSHAQTTSCRDKGMKVMETAWSECSKSCGVGVSVRMHNHNSACELRLQTRLCIDKPCDLYLPQLKCSEASGLYKLGTPLTLSFHNCTSQPLNHWKLCGDCRNQQGTTLCCRPSATSSKKLDMTCDGVTESKVDEDGGVWLNRGELQGRKVQTTMEVREVNMCSCSQEFC